MFTIRLTAGFDAWLRGLRDREGRMRIVARLRHAGAGNLGDWKALGEGLCEMRVDAGPGYRLYFTRRGRVLIVLLKGGDKSTQERDIRKARTLLKELELE